VTKVEALKLAHEWIASWNAHDLERILAHYEDEVELISPVAARLLETPEGRISGKTHLRAYFQRGLEAYPNLQFHLEDVLLGVHSVRSLL
jgi:ketosteroid isomerase-like protein